MNKITTQREQKLNEADLSEKNPDLCEVIHVQDTAHIHEPGFLTQDTILVDLKKAESFSVISLKLDHTKDTDANREKIIEKTEFILSGLNCLLEKSEGYYFCYLPEIDKKQAIDYSESLKNHLNSFGITEIYLGISVYPELTYPKKEMRDNSIKANVHSTYFDPGMMYVSFLMIPCAAIGT